MNQKFINFSKVDQLINGEHEIQSGGIWPKNSCFYMSYFRVRDVNVAKVLLLLCRQTSAMVVLLLVGNCLLTFTLQQFILFQWFVRSPLDPSLSGRIHIGETRQKTFPVRYLPQSLSSDWVLTSRWPEDSIVPLWPPERRPLGETKFPGELRVVPPSRSLYKSFQDN